MQPQQSDRYLFAPGSNRAVYEAGAAQHSRCRGRSVYRFCQSARAIHAIVDSSVSQSARHANLLEIIRVSKFSSWLQYCSKALIPKMQNVRLPYNISGMSQAAALAAWEDQTFTRKVKQQIFAARKQWHQFFDQHQIRHYATQTNFMLYQVNDPQALGTFLKQHGYLVRDSMVPGWIRQSFGTPKQDAEVQQLLLTF